MELSGVAAANAAGGQNVSIKAAHSVGSESLSGVAGAFAAGNTNGGPTTAGLFAGVGSHGHSITLEHARIQGVGKTDTASSNLNLLNNGTHSINANAFHSRTQLDTGLNFHKNGAGLGWQHAQGHAASVGVAQVPQFNMTTANAAATANLWSSQNRATTLDLNANASRHLSGPFAGKNDFGVNMGIKHRF